MRGFLSPFGMPGNKQFSRSSILLSPDGSDNSSLSGNSVTGPIYDVESGIRADFPIVQLYTKEGCTLCDKAKDVLKSVRDDHPHSLEALDITDDDKSDIYDKYKWDIPVLHINGMYWTKHRLEASEAAQALDAAKNGAFEVQRGEPDAGAMERRMAERNAQTEK